ncbi:MAG: DUF4932 domain-containing protein [Flavobacteriales bacterium]|nr:DUF4932 domain-containing protein [Flavobacteriales bacterium]
MKHLYPLTILIAFSLVMLFYSCNSEMHSHEEEKNLMEARYSETYELANIILALTDYGMTDPSEVHKDFSYANKVQVYFAPVNDHPLLDSVNYSRERWEEFLSFRTDAYAFEFNNGDRLTRTTPFYTNEGVQPFDDHLDLINDFAQKSNFRAFFKEHDNYYQSVCYEYRSTQNLSGIQAFLNSEFDNQKFERQRIALISSFVGRMNCHRNVDSLTLVDFITLPDYITYDSIKANDEELATSYHYLFTELDHGFVNPTSDFYQSALDSCFNAEVWDDESGYNENGGNGVFNEYMTWAVYDLFLKEQFPEVAEEINLYWCYQNESRGFPYAYLFNQELQKLYERKSENETVKDLYPELLAWCSQVENNLSKPRLNIPGDSISIAFTNNTEVSILFSEPMRKDTIITTFLHDGVGSKDTLEISVSRNSLSWSEDAMTLSFDIALPDYSPVSFLQFNWWGAKYPVVSEKGILLKNASYFRLVDSSMNEDS